MDVVRLEREAAEREAASILDRAIREAVESRGRAVVAIPGGRSIGGILARLATSAAPLEKLELFFVDERCVPLDDERSNYRVAEQFLISPRAEHGMPIPAERIHPFRCNPDAADLGTEAYDVELSGVAERVDVVVLGLGEDGHIASLFPGRELGLEERGRFTAVFGAPKPPPERMSATPRLLTESETVVLVAFGEGKQNALRAFLAEEGAVVDCPARIVREHSGLHVMTDLPA
jgi:6-phosphogluconolactonase